MFVVSGREPTIVYHFRFSIRCFADIVDQGRRGLGVSQRRGKGRKSDGENGLEAADRHVPPPLISFLECVVSE